MENIFLFPKAKLTKRILDNFLANKLTLVGRILLHTFQAKCFTTGSTFRFHKVFQNLSTCPVFELSPLD
jgi:hypothetical protein